MLNMNTKNISPIIILSISIILLFTGILAIYDIAILARATAAIVTSYMIIIGILSVLTYIFNREKRLIGTLISGIGDIILAIFIYYKGMFIAISITRLIGMYAFLNFIARIIAAIILYKNKTKGWISGFINSFVSLIFGIILVFNPKEYMKIVPLIAGIYLILYGLTLFADFVKEISYADLIKDNLKRRIRITLPIIYSAFIPQRILEKINTLIEANPKETIFVDSKSNAEGQLEIFIHLAEDVANGFGHVDICFENKIYSYGTYDSSSDRFFRLISDGVLFEVEREEYIKFSTVDSQRYLIGFELLLSDTQCDAVRKKILDIKGNCIEWKCRAEINQNEKYDDYSSELYLASGAKFYKFKSGYFKTYYTLTANCVKLADTIVGSAGLDIIGANGIITPGTYFNYLNNLFARKNTIVIKRNIYTKIM